MTDWPQITSEDELEQHYLEKIPPKEQDAAEAEAHLRARLEEPVVDPGQAAMVAVIDALIAELMGGEVKP